MAAVSELRDLIGARRRAGTESAVLAADIWADTAAALSRDRLGELDGLIVAGVSRGDWTADDIATAFRAAGSVAVPPDLAKRLERAPAAV